MIRLSLCAFIILSNVFVQTKELDSSQDYKNCILTLSQQLELANKYYSGDGQEQNYEKALYFYELVASQTDNYTLANKALIAIGKMHYFGYGVSQSIKSALEYFEKAANQITSPAFQAEISVLIGDCYFFTNPLNLNPHNDFTWSHEDNCLIYDQKKVNDYLQSKDAPYLRDLMPMVVDIRHGDYYALGEVEPNNAKVFQYWEQAIDQHDNVAASMAASVRLGELYYFGLCDQAIDYEKAYHYFKKAITTQDDRRAWVKAHLRLAEIYITGRGVEKDYSKARDHLELILSVEHSYITNTLEATTLLAEMYYFGGYGITQNYEKSYEYLQKIVEIEGRTYEYSCDMNFYLMTGLRSTIDAHKTKRSSKNITDLNCDFNCKYFVHNTADFILGKMHYFGFGTPVNYSKALQHFNEIENRDWIISGKETIYHCYLQEQANFFIAEMYYFGLGVEKNHALAYDYYQRLTAFDPVLLANKNLRLSQIHYDGYQVLLCVGVYRIEQQDYKKARNYFQLAADQYDAPEIAAEAKKALASWWVPDNYVS